ncbi:hypothetical protein Mucpa_2703 [Mucilaginibacter paludis DSM 18603]|uniref:Uncharacterized protein n=1 Tax=Mucilaginibacter paludis DSM 18603 TaxID=714943 RepID=H1Y6M3_9SPHI|nr:hypothetical protein Mucpa_2703 [Mucilaginibacter paludis DSM 18603]
MRSSVEQQFEKAMETITKFFKEEKDFLYRKGEVKGREEGREEGEYRKSLAIAAEMKKDGFSVEQINKFTKLSVEEIERL